MAKLSKFRYSLKIIRITWHLLRGLFICFVFFPWLSKDSKKDHIQCWSRQLLAIFNVRLNLNSGPVLPGSVIISNHISWLDIFVINSLSPSRFVAKADIRSWPILGWLAAQAGTIYISRGSKSDLKRIYRYLIDQVEAGEQIAFFPEGTTASQGQVLPFHSNLFEAAIHAKVPVQPVALRYLNAMGELHPAVDYSGDTTFVTSLMNVLNGGEITAELHGLEFIASDGMHRRDLAKSARRAVAMALQVEIE